MVAQAVDGVGIGLMGMDNPATKGLKVLNNLKRYIESMDEPKLEKFLRFATGSSSLSLHSWRRDSAIMFLSMRAYLEK